jgi:hypothetical protein
MMKTFLLTLPREGFYEAANLCDSLSDLANINTIIHNSDSG